MSKTKQHLLLIIDSQKGIDETDHWGGNRNNPDAEENIALLLKVFRQFSMPIIHVQHCSTEPTSPLRPNQIGHDFKETNLPKAGEVIIQKTRTSAFIGTDLETQIKKTGATTVVIVGFVTNNSVEATARMSGDLGFQTIVIADATATFDKKGYEDDYGAELVHDLSLGNLQGEYASIMLTQELVSQYIQPSLTHQSAIEAIETITLLTPAQIKDIAEDIHCGLKCFIHKKTKAILKIIDNQDFDDYTDELQRKELDELEANSADYHEIEKMSSREAFNVMEDFVHTIPKPNLKKRLINALNKRGPFRHFNYAIDDSDYREKWFAFRTAQQIEWVKQQVLFLEQSLNEEGKEEAA